MKRTLMNLLLAGSMALSLAACGGQTHPDASEQDNSPTLDTSSASAPTPAAEPSEIPADFVLIEGGTF